MMNRYRSASSHRKHRWGSKWHRQTQRVMQCRDLEGGTKIQQTATASFRTKIRNDQQDSSLLGDCLREPPTSVCLAGRGRRGGIAVSEEGGGSGVWGCQIGIQDLLCKLCLYVHVYDKC